MATVAPDVLSQALSERAEDVPGVERCTVWVTGSPSSLWVQADTTVSQDCEVEWAVAELRRRMEDDVTTSLGTSPVGSTSWCAWSAPRARAASRRPSQGSTRPRSPGTAMTHDIQDEAVPAPRPRPHHAAQPSTSSATPQDKDRYLVLRAQDGDINAFEQLVERYQGACSAPPT